MYSMNITVSSCEDLTGTNKKHYLSVIIDKEG